MTALASAFDDEYDSGAGSPNHAVSGSLASQLITWHAHNWTGSGNSGRYGEWLRSLKATSEGDRQYVWSEDAIRGIVTFAGWVRDCDGFYEGWGSITRLERPVTRRALLRHPVTRSRFDASGIKALQGLPIRLQPALAAAIDEMTGRPGATDIPADRPDFSEEPILWAGEHGLAPEAYIEGAVGASRSLWRWLGFPSAPDRQVYLGAAGRCDLLAGGVVGEAKRVVTLANGPDQIERYLSFLRFQTRMPRSALKGVLLQCHEATSQAVIERLKASPYSLELWSVYDDGYGWEMERLA